MPGISVVAGMSIPADDDIEAAHRPSLYDDRYTFDSYEAGHCSVARALYPEYPFRQVTFGDCTVFVEGVVYNRDEETLRAELERRFVDGEASPVDPTWLRDLDGEFVFYAHDAAAGTVTIVPDLLGQLPLFYAVHTDYALVGRNKPILARLGNCATFDRVAVAEYLRLGYALADRTLYADLRRLPQGYHIQIDTDTGSQAIDQHYEFDFDDERNADASVTENAREFARRFTNACKRRADSAPGENVVLLSGGLDSRAILGGFERCGVSYSAATRDFEHDSRADIDLARELTDAVGSNWDRLPTPGPDGSDLLAHLDMGGGADPFGIAHMQPFLRQIRADHDGPVWTYTGDGGDKLVPDISPVVDIETIDELVSYIMQSEETFSAEDVEAMTGVAEAEVRADVRETVREYPETSLSKRFVHYELFQRAFSWLFEATDTNRNHCWTTSPFYAPDVVDCAMSIPDAQKRRYQLYAAVLKQLSPELATVPNANFGAPPASVTHEARVALYNVLQRHPALFDVVKPTIKSLLGLNGEADRATSPFVDCLRDQVTRNPRSILDREGLEQTILDDPESYTREELCHVLTLASLIDNHRDVPILTEYRSEEFV
ncbi:asparagine synthase-related protein [Halomicroarcula sp. S1AR25-4]|uniref:asparagine synthase-related protein n=1 Tax=Haloarcula sp. S1AR25-4 TaxID=2950538 RepID=UPI002876B0E3|nr:asparagine synthase-related protein [Halomicroarcula sp. S1AR25-4]MDS0278517.1 asparagine synthase-related protein [Halomicroarcula sp. S1AR25-4]